MAGYYKSKEVYKQHRDENDIPHVFPVRGLYVSGTHVEPLYQDHNVTITSYTSSNINVVDYTEADANLEIHQINTLDFGSIPGNIDVVQYTQAEASREMGHAINTLDFESINGNIDFVSYETSATNIEIGHTINTLDFGVLNANINTQQSLSVDSTSRESIIAVVGFTSGPIVVT